MPEDRISPHYGLAKLGAAATIDDKIDVYEDRLQGWIFDHANVLVSDEYPLRDQAGIAVALLTSGYFEQFWSFRTGRESNGKEFEFFKNGFDNIFRDIDADHRQRVAGLFWGEVRSRLAHELCPGGRVIIDPDQAGPLGYMYKQSHIGSIIINPKLFLRGLQEHFRAYVALLRNPSNSELRANFETLFDLITTRQGPVPPAK